MIIRITINIVVDFYAITIIIELQTFEINLKNQSIRYIQTHYNSKRQHLFLNLIVISISKFNERINL